jgi:hypothetical protein
MRIVCLEIDPEAAEQDEQEVVVGGKPRNLGGIRRQPLAAGMRRQRADVHRRRFLLAIGRERSVDHYRFREVFLDAAQRPDIFFPQFHTACNIYELRRSDELIDIFSDLQPIEVIGCVEFLAVDICFPGAIVGE